MIQLAVFSQDSLKIVSTDSFKISNLDGIKINQFLIDRKKCYEALEIEKKYSQGKDSIGLQYKDIIQRMNTSDSLYERLTLNYQELLKMKDFKYTDMKSTYQAYNKDLQKQVKKQNNKTIGIIVTVLTVLTGGTVLAIVLH